MLWFMIVVVFIGDDGKFRLSTERFETYEQCDARANAVIADAGKPEGMMALKAAGATSIQVLCSDNVIKPEPSK